MGAGGHHEPVRGRVRHRQPLGALPLHGRHLPQTVPLLRAVRGMAWRGVCVDWDGRTVGVMSCTAQRSPSPLPPSPPPLSYTPPSPPITSLGTSPSGT